ncbi:MAG: hypothetical protein CFE25_01355 [Chitinophagaceae bacterium BSSC1]|nr:MAG: hypothetical protein CFE25_01355 [Chitinophagaceae bacterium BSSC1]
MRKTILSTLVMFFFLFASIAKTQAQAALLVLIFGDKAATEKFNFSIVGGINHSNISNQLDNHAMFGTNFGLGINMKLSEKWYFKPEFKPLNSMGFKGNASLKTGTIVDGPFANVPTTRSLNYLDIPVMMHYQAAEKILIGFGPQVNFLTKAQEKFEGKNDATYDQNIKDKLNKTDYGFAAAFTYQLITKRNGKGINLQLRYYQGVSDVYKNLGSNKNSAFSFNLEFPFISDAVAEKKMANLK